MSSHLQHDRTLTNLQPEAALDNYKKALALDGENAVFHHNVGLCYVQLALDADAVYHLRRAVGLSPDDQEMRLNLADAYMRMGEPERAADQYQRVADRAGDNKEYVMACLKEARRQVDERDAV